MFTILNHSEVVTIPSTAYYNVLVTHVKKWNCVLLGTFRADKKQTLCSNTNVIHVEYYLLRS